MTWFTFRDVGIRQYIELRWSTSKAAGLLDKEDKEVNYSNINHSNVFLGQFPKAIEIKTKINKRDLIELWNIFHSKGNHLKKKRKKKKKGQPTES